MTNHLFRRRSQLLISVAAVATLAVVPAASGATADRHHDAASNQAAKARNAAKRATPATARADVASAKEGVPAQEARLGLASGEKLVVKDVQVDADGTRHIRYDRTFDGLRVIGGDLVVHQTKGGALKGVNQAHAGSVAVASTTPTVSKAKARAAADDHVSFAAKGGSGQLVVFAGGAKPVLAWESIVEGVKKDQTPSRMHVITDAHTGKVLSQWDAIQTADSGTGNSIYSGTVKIGTSGSSGAFTMKDASRGGNYTTDLQGKTAGTGTTFTDADNTWGNGSTSDRASAGVDAHYGAQVTWDYYANRHGRSGIFNNGKGVPSRVHYGNSYVNAFWDGTQMTYGDGAGNADPLVELDVAGHEMSHGVTEHSAGLNYSGDAGGLNEATSDIFGTGVEWYANNANDKPDYLIGEMIDINGNGTPLRYMDKPSKDGGSYDCWNSSVGNADPHYSSGPANHWFYLASEGSGAKTINGVSYNSPTCNSSTVTGIGHQKAEDIWYRALTTYMTSTETYPQARNAAIQSAIDLYGASSTECATTAAAFSAIGVPAGTTSCSGGTTPPPTSGCTTGTVLTGSLSGAGAYAYQPGSNGYFHSTTGKITGCLSGPSGTDFDLYLQKWNGSSWVDVAKSTSSSSSESINYSGTAGDYSFVVESYSGSGSYSFSYTG